MGFKTSTSQLSKPPMIVLSIELGRCDREIPGNYRNQTGLHSIIFPLVDGHRLGDEENNTGKKEWDPVESAGKSIQRQTQKLLEKVNNRRDEEGRLHMA